MRKKDKSPKKRKAQKVGYVLHNMRSTCPRTTFIEIRRLQSTTNLIIPKLPFSRLVREIFMQFAEVGTFRVQYLAMQALQEAAEKYLVDMFADANLCCAHAKRATLFPKDMRLVLDIRGQTDPGFRLQ